MIRTQRHSRFVLMSLDEIRATRDIVLQTEETKSNFSGSGKTVYICEVVRPCDYQKETDTAADKLAAEIERVNADMRSSRRTLQTPPRIPCKPHSRITALSSWNTRGRLTIRSRIRKPRGSW